MRQASPENSLMFNVQEVSDIVFSSNRASNETRLLRSKVCQMIGTSLQAMADASCKTLRRRVGQRLRRKLGRILMQEEFEQALAIYKRYEDELLSEDPDSLQDREATPPRSTSSSPVGTMHVAPPVCVAVPVITVPVLVPVMAPAAGHGGPVSTTPFGPVPSEPVEPVSPAMTEVTIPPFQPYLDVQKESRTFTRLSTDTTTCTCSSVMDDEDFLDQQIDWMRSVSDGAPVERTFIQFNTNLKVHRRSRSR